MATPPIRIRIGASIDGSVDRVFRTVAQRAHKAQAAVQREQRATTRAAEQEAKKQLRAQETLNRAAESLARQRSRALYAQYQADTRAAEQAARAAERAQQQAQARIRREIDQTVKATERAQARERQAQHRAATRQGESFARRTSHRATRFLMPTAPIGSMAMRFGRDVTQAAGLDASFGGAIGRNVATEMALTDAVNSARFAGQEVNFRELRGRVGATAKAMGMSSGDVSGGLLGFQKKTGDLTLGQQVMEPLARLSVATGTSFEDMANAAADVSNALGDVPNKAERIVDVLRTVAGQGARGAVEISDLAQSMATLGAAAGKFEGDAGKNLERLGALAQLARATGGAASAREATTSIARFSDQLMTPARIKQFKAAGVDVFSDKEAGKFADPIEVIKRALVATKGDPEKMSRLFMSTVGRKPVQALSTEFLGAGGAKDAEAGLAAVDKKLAVFLENAALDRSKVDQAVNDSLETTARRAARVQEAWDSAVLSMQSKLLPALEQASPALIKFAEVVGSITTWAAENPKTAIAAALSASIARAGIESTLRAGIERVILGPQAAGAAKVGAAAASMGGALATASAAVGTFIASFMATKAVIDAVGDHFDEVRREKFRESAEGTNAGSEAQAALKRAEAAEAAGDPVEAARQLSIARGHASQAVTAERAGVEDMKNRGGILRTAGDFLFTPINEQGKGGMLDLRDRREARELEQRKQDLANMERILASIDAKLGGKLKIEMPPAAAPTTNIPGRASQ